ncbi:hypothetical protein ABPG72_015684 [Tetrahymena utriculariae]
MDNDFIYQDVTIKKNLKTKKQNYPNQYFSTKQQSLEQESQKIAQYTQKQDLEEQKILFNASNITQYIKNKHNLEAFNLQEQMQLTINSDLAYDQLIKQQGSIKLIYQGDLSYELRIWDREQAKKEAISTLDLKYRNKVDTILDKLLQKQYYLATTLNNLGLLYKDIGDYQNAIKYMQESYELKKTIFSSSHPEISISLNT